MGAVVFGEFKTARAVNGKKSAPKDRHRTGPGAHERGDVNQKYDKAEFFHGISMFVYIRCLVSLISQRCGGCKGKRGERVIWDFGMRNWEFGFGKRVLEV
jgi:hypothetical protein